MFDTLKTAQGRLAIGGLALAGIVALGVVPMVAAASPSPAPSPSPAASTVPTASPVAPATAAARRFAGIRAAILAGTVRADATVVKRDGTTLLIHYERGAITAITPTSITITGRDGKGASFTVTGKTRVRSNGKVIAYGDLKVGDRAMVFGTADGGTYTAVIIRCVQRVAQP